MKLAPLVLLVTVLGSASLARAQAPDTTPTAEPQPTAHEQVLLRGRNRSLLHPSEPLQISGREQGDNTMRAGTPALQRGNTATGGVSRDDNYRRAIAMVESRAVFTSPPTRAALEIPVGDGSTEAPAPRPKRAATKSPIPAPASSNMPWALGGVVVFALSIAAWFYARNRS